ncbi:autotransporter outer membrane beta-barrel domain-containing protein [Citrobacter sp. SX206]|uniref:autotransporter outer membrane beta-barrel domain-containing protein n=1 Tax=unclassified Citrobacter TaxID=2644389 RepID=UPI0020A37FEE|nr:MULTISPECIES: autotransporter outer membrane beta-barrel domain-containing protein [unclassified Citrobacter]UTD18556.1 autotransporter outer membrane beta-barrel domain-containing protein [Citrobacter sp. SX206]UTD22885.1 autotransporter outer membrane beta-barrel domain-containing protein [Citrobacter sp. SX212]
MNAIYNIVWSTARNMFVVAGEFSRGNNGMRNSIRVTGLATLICSAAVNAAGLGPQNGASIILNDNEVVTASGQTNTTGVESITTGGDGLQIKGKATINVSGETLSTGVSLDNGTKNDLGTNTEIHVVDTDGTQNSSKNTTGILISGNNLGTEVTASGINIDVSGKNNVYGFKNIGKDSNVDLGSGSSITAITETDYSIGGIGDARGVYLLGGSGTFTMDNGFIHATSIDNTAWGIQSTGNAKIDLGKNSQVVVEGNNIATGIEIGTDGVLDADQLTVTATGLATDYGSVTGLKLGKNNHVDLGDNSRVTINGASDLAEGIYVMGPDATLIANNMDINISTTLDCRTGGCTTRGIAINGAGSRIDLGSGSTISITGFYDGAGVTINPAAKGSEFIADNLTIDVTGTQVSAISMSTGFMDLGQNSIISAAGGATTLWVTGGEFHADALTVNTAQSVGIIAQGGDVMIGAGSVVDGRSSAMSGSATSGIAATSGSTLDFKGDADNRNVIYAIDGYGVSSQFYGATVNIANTDILMSGQNNPYGLWAIGSNNLNRPGIINGENLTIDVTASGANGYGAVVQQGGAISLTGDTTIKTQDGVAILVPVVTDSAGNLLPGGTVTGSGVMDITGDIISAGEGSISLDMASGSRLVGATFVNTDPTVDSSLNLSLAEQTQWTITGDSSLTQLNNAGDIVFDTPSQNGQFKTLTINGNYHGDNSHLYLNTQLGDDNSPTDKVIITGDTSGSTTLYVNNIGGEGALTTKGIEVIDVGGQSDGVFTQGNQVQTGLYEYRLYEDGGDWYLRSQAVPPVDPDDGDDVTPVDPDDGDDVTPVYPDDGGDVTPVYPDDGGDSKPVDPQYRADIGAYLGNQWMARNLQMQTLYDREGSQLRTDDGSMWMRFKAGDASSTAADGHVDIDNTYSQLQIGGDVLSWDNGEQSLKAGLMVSYINADTDSTGNRGADGSRFSASGNVAGYNLGAYATWFADAKNHSGLYVDSWYQYGLYNNSVDNGDVGSTDYDSAASAASLETGYRYDIGLENLNTVSLTPQAQVTWQQYKADAVVQNGTRIDGQNGDSWTTRLGLRVDGKLHKNTTSVIQPFAEVNWLHTSDDVGVAFDGAEVKQDLPADRAEVKVGIQANLNSQWSITGQVAGQKGRNDYGDLSGSLLVRYSW